MLRKALSICSRRCKDVETSTTCRVALDLFEEPADMVEGFWLCSIETYSCRRDRAGIRVVAIEQQCCRIETKRLAIYVPSSHQTAKRQQNISRPRLLRIAAVGVRVSACRVSLVACSSVITLWLTGIVFGNNLRRIGGECHDAPAGRLPAAAGARLGALA